MLKHIEIHDCDDQSRIELHVLRMQLGFAAEFERQLDLSCELKEFAPVLSGQAIITARNPEAPKAFDTLVERTHRQLDHSAKIREDIANEKRQSFEQFKRDAENL